MTSSSPITGKNVVKLSLAEWVKVAVAIGAAISSVAITWASINKRLDDLDTKLDMNRAATSAEISYIRRDIDKIDTQVEKLRDGNGHRISKTT